MIFDIGANIGAWTLTNINSCDKIIAVEPAPITFEALCRNCKQKQNVIVFLNYAVCNNGGKDITFYDSETHTISTLNKDWLTSPDSRFYNHSSYREITCKTITIDRLIELYGKPELIKIDVEGGEYDCISSLTQKVKLLCFEWASETNSITFKCMDHLSSLGFTHFYIQDGDDYTFRPTACDFYDITTVKAKLLNTVPKKDWGMIWCK